MVGSKGDPLNADDDFSRIALWKSYFCSYIFLNFKKEYSPVYVVNGAVENAMPVMVVTDNSFFFQI
jgi:hypothetical protein